MQDQYDNICKERFDEILTAVHEIQNRLWKDNGKESIQSTINRHDKWIKWVAGGMTIISTGLFGVALWVLKIYLTKSL